MCCCYEISLKPALSGSSNFERNTGARCTELAAERMAESEKETRVVLVHHGGEPVLAACCELLRAQWGRSEAVRMRSLRACGDSPPVGLALTGRGGRVVAHCRLAPVHGEPARLLLESLVVAEELRGAGLGSRLVRAAEEHARALGASALVLYTRGQEGFYARLGYSTPEPAQKPTPAACIVSVRPSAVAGAPPPPPLPPPLLFHDARTFMIKYL